MAQIWLKFNLSEWSEKSWFECYILIRSFDCFYHSSVNFSLSGKKAYFQVVKQRGFFLNRSDF